MFVKLSGVILAVVILASVGVGAAAYFGIISVPYFVLARLTGAKPPEHSARYYPQDSIAYAWMTLVPGGGQFNDMQEIWERFNEFRAFRKWVEDAYDDFESETEIDFEEQVKPWIGPDISAALIEFESDSEKPVAAAILGVRDGEAADDFLRDWLDYLGNAEGADFDSDHYEGFNIWLGEDNDWGNYALTEDMLVFATTPDALEDVLDRIAGDDLPSLDSNENFIAARAALPERRFTSAYLDVRQTLDLLEEQYADLEEGYADELGIPRVGLPEDLEPDWVAASAAWIEGGIVFEGVAPTTTGFGSELAALSNPAELLPDTVLGFVAASFNPDVDQWREELDEYALSDILPEPGLIDEINSELAEFATYQAGIESSPPKLDQDSDLSDALDIGLWFMAEITGIDWEDDFFDHLGGQLVIAVNDFDFMEVKDDTVNNPVAAVAMLSYPETSHDDLADTINDIVGLIEEQTELKAETVDVGGGNAQVFDLEEMFGDTQYPPGYVMYDGYLTIGTTADALETIVARQNGEGDLLASVGRYARAHGRLPTGQQFIGYVDLHRIIDQLDRRDLGLNRDQYEVLSEGIGAVVVGSSNTEDFSRVTIILTFFPTE